jgi:hypothetical protein
MNHGLRLDRSGHERKISFMRRSSTSTSTSVMGMKMLSSSIGRGTTFIVSSTIFLYLDKRI